MSQKFFTPGGNSSRSIIIRERRPHSNVAYTIPIIHVIDGLTHHSIDFYGWAIDTFRQVSHLRILRR
ncbi:hypothetical protein BABINDRAFT_163807 [Babjeviella inositovora NRRL Y-12698]|uniref:Uncharacterized protein n=1 Tax=Babjeviella inositovora NRRL Y-12698 TaxID=984486 RepID=A0A1E3QJ25_9ASCO|nr:uncharacterized protein BABINDRAFT_163807 [Babjeviella inositovora NRRL Y-12698]ODQ77072.1 hypothetical protein BABINDRAFT_163807 [Babjeviella inositovora NRRL Y-12698]